MTSVWGDRASVFDRKGSANKQDFAAPVLERGIREGGRTKFSPSNSRDTSETKTLYKTADLSGAARVTLLTPVTGRRIRLVRMEMRGDGSVAANSYGAIYFGTGAAVTTNPGSAVWMYTISATVGDTNSWSRGIGPRGGKDEVLSLIPILGTNGNALMIIEYVDER